MTSQENAELIERGYDAFNAGDLATLTELFREDVSLYQPGTAAVGGDYRGRDAVFGFFGRLAEASGGTFRAEVEKLYTSDRHAVAIHHATATRNGAALDTRTALVFELANGKVVSMSAVQTDQDAWDAFFSAA
jgi:uncharacterized protein